MCRGIVFLLASPPVLLRIGLGGVSYIHKDPIHLSHLGGKEADEDQPTARGDLNAMNITPLHVHDDPGRDFSSPAVDEYLPFSFQDKDAFIMGQVAVRIEAFPDLGQKTAHLGFMEKVD